MITILQQHFQMHFARWKLLYFDSNFTQLCSGGSNWRKVIIGSESGLMPNKQQTNDDSLPRFLEHIYIYIYIYIYIRWAYIYGCIEALRPLFITKTPSDWYENPHYKPKPDLRPSPVIIAGLILGLHSANEIRRYKVSHWLCANLESVL